MGLKFHRGDKQTYSGYTGSRAWNNDDLLKHPFDGAPDPGWLKDWKR